MVTDTAIRRGVLLGHLLATHHQHIGDRPPSTNGRASPLGTMLGNHDPDLAEVLRIELAGLLDGHDPASPAYAHTLAERLNGTETHRRDALWALLGCDDRLLDAGWLAAVAPGRPATPRRARFRPTWLVRQAAAAIMNAIVAATILISWVIVRETGDGPADIAWTTCTLKVFAVWCFAFLPCWLYIRFLGQRAGALWDEYVLNLHRLGWDKPRFLPRPPRTSQAYEDWAADGGRQQIQHRNIYRQKFNCYYGRSVPDNAVDTDSRVTLDTLFPVLVTTAVFSVCWTAVLWDDRFLRAPADVWDVMKFGFLGSYVFIVQTLIRRFFASDLRPSAYTSALVRITIVLVGVAPLVQVLDLWLAATDPAVRYRWESAAVFVIGFFPLVATQVVLRASSSLLRTSATALDSDYPLSQLDGLNIWYAARLAEENIDDMQNLATANFVDIMLHTRVPVGRLVDWVDQAFLFLHLDRVERTAREHRRAAKPATGTSPAPPADPAAPTSVPEPAGTVPALAGSSLSPSSRGGTRTRTVLRQLGIRTATDLLKAFGPTVPAPSGNGHPVAPDLGDALAGTGVEPSQIRMLVRVLSQEKGLAPVWNWHNHGVPMRS